MLQVCGLLWKERCVALSCHLAMWGMSLTLHQPCSFGTRLWRHITTLLESHLEAWPSNGVCRTLMFPLPRESMFLLYSLGSWTKRNWSAFQFEIMCLKARKVFKKWKCIFVIYACTFSSFGIQLGPFWLSMGDKGKTQAESWWKYQTKDDNHRRLCNWIAWDCP